MDDSWRSYFTELIGDGNGAKPHPSQTRRRAPSTQQITLLLRRTRTKTLATPAPIPTDAEAIPLRGPALKIVENMEASLSVPTATSERRIPVKRLDENRRIINQHLAENDRGKASYTPIIAWALLRARRFVSTAHDGYAEIDNAPTRLKRASVNLGVAVI